MVPLTGRPVDLKKCLFDVTFEFCLITDKSWKIIDNWSKFKYCDLQCPHFLTAHNSNFCKMRCQKLGAPQTLIKGIIWIFGNCSPLPIQPLTQQHKVGPCWGTPPNKFCRLDRLIWMYIFILNFFSWPVWFYMAQCTWGINRFSFNRGILAPDCRICLI